MASTQAQSSSFSPEDMEVQTHLDNMPGIDVQKASKKEVSEMCEQAVLLSLERRGVACEVSGFGARMHIQKSNLSHTVTLGAQLPVGTCSSSFFFNAEEVAATIAQCASKEDYIVLEASVRSWEPYICEFMIHLGFEIHSPSLETRMNNLRV